MLLSFISVLSVNSSMMIQANAAEGRLYNQNDSYWKTMKFTKYASSGNDMYTSGCGIFSFCNAIYALNGGKVDAVELATWAVNNGSYQPGNGGLYRQAFYNKIEAGYGSSYGFKIDGQYKGTISDSRLISHLQNGGVAAIHVYNHFMAVTGYNASNGTYHVIESAVYSGRGLQADSWVSASKLSSGSTNVDWYAIISSTGTPPTAPSLSINKRAGLATDRITISWDSVQGADFYWLHIYKDGEDYVNQTLNQVLSYSAKYPVGNYVAYVVSCNSVGETLSMVTFTIYNGVPGKPTPKISKTLFAANENVDITWFATANTDSYWLHIYKNGEDYVNQILGQDLSYSATYPAGEYVAYIVSCNGLAETLSSVEFTVYDSAPDKPNPKISKTVFTTSEKVDITWDAIENGEYYWLHIYKDDEDYVNKSLNQDLSYSSTYPSGKYVAYIVSCNSYGETLSSVSFQVIGNLKATLNANGGTCSVTNKSVTYNNTYGDLPKPTGTGYSFAGWYTEKDGGTEIKEDTIVSVTTDQTLYAHWTPNQYTLTVNPNGGSYGKNTSAVVQSPNLIYGSSNWWNIGTAQRNGYTLTGYFTEATGGTKVYDANGEAVDSQYWNDNKYIYAGNLTVYAQWNAVKITGDVNSDGAVNVADSVIMQGYLMQRNSFSENEFHAADLNDDGYVDVFDMILMRRLLISK